MTKVVRYKGIDGEFVHILGSEKFAEVAIVETDLSIGPLKDKAWEDVWCIRDEIGEVAFDSFLSKYRDRIFRKLFS